MEFVKYVVMGIYFVICIALIIVCTIQTKDSQGASGTITGSTTNNFYEKNKGRTKEGKLKRLTIFLGVLFAVVGITLAILYMV